MGETQPYEILTISMKSLNYRTLYWSIKWVMISSLVMMILRLTRGLD